MIKNIEEKFKKCFELAVQGETLAFPNPNVACLIYFKEELIAQGIHREFGKAHAEVHAINDAKKYFSETLNLKIKYDSFEAFASECELILNLEPCSHYGNTPPCTSLIQESGFKKIAFAAYDTNPKVYKKSLEKFSDINYQIIKPEDLSTEIQKEAQFINRSFFSIKAKESENKLAVYISVKVASYSDGKMLTKDSNKWISSKKSRKDVHKLRSTNQLIITSSSTIIADKPKYNVRHSHQDLDLLDTKDPDICVVYNKKKIELDDIKSPRKVFYEKLNSLEEDSLKKLIRKLSFQGYQKIMIEAGPRLSRAFIKSKLVDELIIYQPKSNQLIEACIKNNQEIFDFKADQIEYADFKDDYKLMLLALNTQLN
jgi:diaminohydroxyphosphoribosylaminopyrimidine deaminase / 5-amino-6-(5-phosphoribosylamino)uracil reductase